MAQPLWILAAAAVLIPGLGAVFAGWQSPPELGAIFGASTLVIGTVILVLLWLNRTLIQRLSPRQLRARAIVLLFLAFVCLTLWLVLFPQCVVEHSARGTAYYPLWLGAQIEQMVTRAGGRLAAIEQYGIAAVQLAIEKMPGIETARPVTTISLLLLFQAQYTLTAAALGVLALAKDHSAAADLTGTRVFISYRRRDEAAAARLVYEQLQMLAAPGDIIMDVESIAPAADFLEAIDKALSSSDAMLVIVGRNWLETEQGERPLHGHDDVVAQEIEMAMALDLPILPILVNGARMPQAKELPNTLASLARRNAVTLNYETFRRDFSRVVDFLAGLPRNGLTG
jgi:hypothetical protein